MCLVRVNMLCDHIYSNLLKDLAINYRFDLAKVHSCVLERYDGRGYLQ